MLVAFVVVKDLLFEHFKVVLDLLQVSIEFLLALFDHLITLLFKQLLLLLPIGNIVLDIDEWECANVIQERDQGVVPFREDRFGKMQSVSQLKTLAREGIPLHDILPLLEGLHGMEFLEKGDISKDILVHTIRDKVLIGNEVRSGILRLSYRHKALLAENHYTAMIVRGVFHFLVH